MRLISQMLFLAILVSIHASVKDATYAERHHTFDPVVSIHASVKDATSFSVVCEMFFQVSIHASVKDATMPMMFPIQTKMFQSTHL